MNMSNGINIPSSCMHSLWIELAQKCFQMKATATATLILSCVLSLTIALPTLDDRQDKQKGLSPSDGMSGPEYKGPYAFRGPNPDPMRYPRSIQRGLRERPGEQRILVPPFGSRPYGLPPGHSTHLQNLQHNNAAMMTSRQRSARQAKSLLPLASYGPPGPPGIKQTAENQPYQNQEHNAALRDDRWTK